MAENFTLDIVTPEAQLASLSVASVTVPGTEGDFGVLNLHAPLISSLRYGVVDVVETNGKAPTRLFVNGGVVEVTGDRCTILATEAKDLKDVSKADAQTAKTHAEKLLSKATEPAAIRAARRSLDEATALLEAL